MKISKIVIDDLFGYFDHEIALKNNDRITILHGPNGVGKTSILRLVYDLFSQRFHTLITIPYSKIIIEVIPDGILTINKNFDGKEKQPYINMNLKGSFGKADYQLSPIGRSEARRSFPMSMVERVVSHLERISPDQWYDRRINSILSLNEVIIKYGEQFPDEFQSLRKPLPDVLSAFFNNLNVSLIETQRLLSYQPIDSNDYQRKSSKNYSKFTVEEYSQDIIKNIQTMLRESGSLSASLDRQFPQRVLATQLPTEATEDNIRKLYSDQTEYRNRLMQAGLIEPESQVSLPAESLGETERKVLWIYLSDVQKKLQLFDNLLARVELLLKIINSRFSYKSFKIDKEKGFTFTSDHDSSDVSLNTLSSGEQHELVLAYDLLFKVQKNSIVFIDEPELSLHVSWQRKFLEDIAKISELASLDFLIATHSPSIIHNRRDLMVGLKSEEF